MNVKSQYLMTEAQIETLAAERNQNLLACDHADGAYLRAIISAVQTKIGASARGKRPTNDMQLKAIETVAVPFYAAVLRGVTTDSIALAEGMEAAEVTRRTRERNRRATFARTAKSALVTWVTEAGGDIRKLSVANVTKTQLVAAVTKVRTEKDVTEISRIEKAQAAILTAAAREGPAAARGHLERVIAALQAAYDAIPTPQAPGVVTGVHSKVNGAPVTFRGTVRRVARERAAA